MSLMIRVVVPEWRSDFSASREFPIELTVAQAIKLKDDLIRDLGNIVSSVEE